MDQDRSLSGVASSNASTLAGLLALLNGGSSGGESGDLFATLLSGTETTSDVSKNEASQTSVTAPATASRYSCLDVSDTGTKTLRALSDLSQTMHKIVSMLRRDNNGQSNSASDQRGNTQTSSVATETTATTGADVAVVVEANNTDAAQSTSAADLADIDLNDPQTLEDVLAELVAVIQYVQQRLQEMQAAQAEGVADVGIDDSLPATPLLDALETLLGTQDVASDATTIDDATVPHSLLETLFRKTDAMAEKLVEALASRAAKIATGDTDEETGAADTLAKLVDLSAEVRATLTSVRRLKAPEDVTIPGDEQNPATIPNDDAAAPAPPLSTAASSDPAALNTVAVASTSTQKLAASSTTSSAKVPETTAPRVTRSETQSRAAIATTKATETSAAFDAPNNAGVATAASPSASADTDFNTSLSSGDSFARGRNENLRGFSWSSEGVGAMGSYTFSSTLSALRATNGGATGLPSAVDQVILHMNRCVKNGDTRISLQLQPGDLGKITVKLDVASDGSVQGTVLADNPKTLEMLQKDSRSLERALQDAGLRAEPGSLEFNLSGQHNPHAGQSDTANASGSNGTLSATESEDDGVVESAALAETYYIRPSGVNIRV